MNKIKIILIGGVLSMIMAALFLSCTRDQAITGFEWLQEDAEGFVDVFPEEVIGSITLAGSSTVFPLAEALADRFKREGYVDNITIDSIGSGGGFERFCVAGESDISNASRPIKEQERGQCRQIGREPLEFHIATDALLVVVNPNNSWISETTIGELAAIFTAGKWSDVRSEWPNEDIQRFIPGTDSGTFDYFIEEIFDDDPAPVLNATNVQFSEDDNILVQGIGGDRYAVGFFGYAYYANNTDALKVLAVEGIEANGENVDNNSYPLARPLFMYSDAEIMANRPQVSAFLAYALLNASDEAINVGYFSVSGAVIQQQQDLWLRTMEGLY